MRLLVCLFLCLFIIVSLPAQAARGDNLTIKVALFGPGDELYTWWGHIALIIDDARTGQSTSYDFGIFSFEEKNFFKNFAFGRLLYSCGSTTAERNIARYINDNRDVFMYTLDLTAARKNEILNFVEMNMLPENRNYLYHHFKDSCSTRIRDIMDIATGGQFKTKFANEVSRFTLRQHGRRFVWFSPLSDWLLCFLMGQDIDRPATAWETMFLPSELANSINGFIYTDENGISRKLVSDVETIYQSQGRPASLEEPGKQWPQGLFVSLIVCLVLVLLFFAQRKYPAPGQVALGIAHSVFGLLFGTAGLLLFFISFFTGHDYTYHNANLLFCNPLLLAAFPLGIKYAVSVNYDKRLFAEFSLRLIWLLVVLGVIASMLIKLLPMFCQDNFAYQILMLPIALVLSLEPYGLKRMLRKIFWRYPY